MNERGVNAGVEGGETAPVFHGESEEVEVGELIGGGKIGKHS